MRIAWRDSVPAVVRQAVERPLERSKWLVPSWVHVLTVCWDPDNQEFTCWTNTNIEYRKASLGVCPGYLSEDASEREATIIHELLHLSLAPMVDFHKDLIVRLCENDELGRWVADQWRERYEGAVCDLETAIVEHAHTRGER